MGILQASVSIPPHQYMAADFAQLDTHYHLAWNALYGHANSHPNSLWFSHFLTAQNLDVNQLPSLLGLNSVQFSQLIQQHFPTLSFENWQLQFANVHAYEKGTIRQQLMEIRQSEWKELLELLMVHRQGLDDSEIWMAHIIAAGCLSNQHLWQDLGLPSRFMLKQLLSYNYPELVEKNTKNMRWKRFFYKQLCEQQGGYVCRAPSCEQCTSYPDCFDDNE